MSQVCSPTENLDRRLLDQIGVVDDKDTKYSLATAKIRIRIPRPCSLKVSHHTEWDMDVSVVGNLVFNWYFQCKKKFEVQEKFVSGCRCYSLSQYIPFEALFLGLCVTNHFESSCIMTSDWCWCRWVPTICCLLHLLLSAHHSVGGPVCWRFQDGGASAGSRPSPLSTHNAPSRQVPCCFGGSSRPGPRIHDHLRPEFFFWARNTWSF